MLDRKSNLVLLGELSKVVPMSSKRVRDISVASDEDIFVTLVGAAGETVVFTVAVDDLHLVDYTCVVGVTGDVTLQVVDGGECEMSARVNRRKVKVEMKNKMPKYASLQRL